MKIIRSDADFCRVRLVKSARAALVAALALVASIAASLALVASIALVAAIASRSSGGAGVWATSALLTWGTVATAPCRRLVRGSKIGKV